MTGQDERVRLARRLERLSPLALDALARALEDDGGDRARLTAFIETAQLEVDGAELRAHLEDRLPDYMIPARYVRVDRLPRTPAGKLDRRAVKAISGDELAAAEPGDFVAPRDETERILARIWGDVLGMDEIGVHDDFFELGGDSLLSIRVISRAGREGVEIAPADFFDAPTIAQLAALSGTARAAAEQGVVTGSAPLAPIHHWFFERVVDSSHHWNQAVLLVPPRSMGADTFERAIRALVGHHDALRTRFVIEDGRRRQRIDEPGEAAPVEVVDLSGVARSDRAARIAVEGARVHASFSLENGPLFRAVLFDGGEDFRRVLLVAHHLVVDAHSWTILLDDLSALVAGAGDRDEPALPRKTSSVIAWAEGLAAAAEEADVAGLRRVWSATERGSSAEAHSSGDRARGDVRTADPATWSRRVELSEAASSEFSDAVSARDGVSPQQAVLAAVATAWSRWSGSPLLQVDVEGHGRDLLSGALDVSRTVGWFTTVFPLALDLRSDSVHDAAAAARDALESLPMRGGSHGLLRYLHPDAAVRDGLAARRYSELLFNYLGTSDGELAPDSPFESATEFAGHARPTDTPPAYGVEINAAVERGRLVLRLTVDATAYGADAVDGLVEHIERAVTDYSREPDGPDTRLDLAGLDDAGLAHLGDLLSEIDGE
jgi:non-ribosomal peptide synthase protein (TIGR01720 family)